jgi:putative membrane protein
LKLRILCAGFTGKKTNLTKKSMKRISTSISGLAIIAIAAGGLCLIENANAQVGEGTRGVGTQSTASHPGLRRTPPPTSQTKLSEKDINFIQDAANAGAAEVADGKVAKERGKSETVKKIGAQMMADHMKTNKELVALAKKKGLGIDIDQGKPRKWDMANFDDQYLASMEKDHQTDIKTFEKEASSGDDADLKSWAAKTLPTLKAHLAMLKDAQRKKKSSAE